jgi:DNA-directed RNA polymerase II subunit RPB2
LHEFGDADLQYLNECPHDAGGYFVINGSEKVIIAQEKMAANTVYVFEKKDPKYLFVGEIRSVLEHTNRPASTLLIKMLRSSNQGRATGQVMQATVPYIKQDIPVIVLFRALGCVHCCCNMPCCGPLLLGVSVIVDGCSSGHSVLLHIGGGT